MRRPDWTYPSWWRWFIVIKLNGETLTTKLNANEFGGGRVGGYLTYSEIQQFMCSVAGCGERAQASWAGCADDNIQRPLCPEHDVQINLMALIWWGDPDWQNKINDYVGSMSLDIQRAIKPWSYDPDTFYRQMMEKINHQGG